MSNGTPNPPEPSLAELIYAKRELLGLTKSAAARRAGLSRETWFQLEKGQRVETRAGTLDRIDVALDWPPGTLRGLLGRGPVMTPTVEPTPTSVDQLWRNRAAAVLATLSGNQLMLVTRYAELVSLHGMLDDDIHTRVASDAGGVQPAVEGDPGTAGGPRTEP